MSTIVFTYAPNVSAGEDLIGFDGKDSFTESYREPLAKRLTVMPTLFYESNYQKIPLEYSPNAVETDARVHFRFASWDLVAAKLYKDEPLDFLLVHKEYRDYGLLIDARGLLIKTEIHGGMAIKEFEKAEPLKEYLETLGIVYGEEKKVSIAPSKKKPINLGFAPLPSEDKEEDSLDTEALAAIKGASFTGNSKKKFHETRFVRDFDDDEEPTLVDVASIKPSFQGNSNKKPKKI